MTRDEFIFSKVWPDRRWHQIEINAASIRYPGKCSCGLYYFTQRDLIEHITESNPDFTTWPGFGMLLKGMKEHERWEEFCIIALHNVQPPLLRLLTPLVKIRMLENIPLQYIAPDPFADEVAKFFGWEEEE